MIALALAILVSAIAYSQGRPDWALMVFILGLAAAGAEAFEAWAR